MKKENSDYYEVRMICYNCAYGSWVFPKFEYFKQKFKKGEKVPKENICPNCGCNTLQIFQ